MRPAQMHAAAAIGVLLSEEGFGHMHFSPNYTVGDPLRTQMGVSRFLSEAFAGGERSTKTFTCYKLLSRIQEPFLFVNPHAGIQLHVAARRSELAYRSRHARRLIAEEVQIRQRRELPNLRRQARQLIAFEVQLPQRRELPDLRRQARQLIAAEVQPLQRRELPDLCRQARQPIADEAQLLQHGFA